MKVLRNVVVKVAWWVLYTREVTGLALADEISWGTWRRALTEYPSVVCGATCAWVVDPALVV